jgi:hypothetical protein
MEPTENPRFARGRAVAIVPYNLGRVRRGRVWGIEPAALFIRFSETIHRLPFDPC